MNHKAKASRLLSGAVSAALMLGTSFMAAPSHAVTELDEAFMRIEINASDGDAGLHGKFDGEGWKLMKIKRPSNGRRDYRLVIYTAWASRNLRKQGVTENFFESTEPLCYDPLKDDDAENDGENFQTVAEFLERFPEGAYKFWGVTNEGYEILVGEYDLTHDLPAAPDIDATDETIMPANSAVVAWAPGDDLGNCSDEDLLPEGTTIVEPTDEVDLWEVTVEPDVEDEDLEDRDLEKTVFTVQLAPEQNGVTVSCEYFRQYLDAELESDSSPAPITSFKFEVGSKYLENQTFSEGGFTVTDTAC